MTFKTLYIWLWPVSFFAVRGGHSLTGESTVALAQWVPWRCPWHKVTGLLCPSCGLTRSTLASWNFNWQEAFHFHFLGPFVLFVSAFIWCHWLLKKEIHWSQWVPKSVPMRIGIVGAYAAWGFSRNWWGPFQG